MHFGLLCLHHFECLFKDTLVAYCCASCCTVNACFRVPRSPSPHKVAKVASTTKSGTVTTTIKSSRHGQKIDLVQQKRLERDLKRQQREEEEKKVVDTAL